MKNRGKQFEQRIKEAFSKIPDVSIDRIHDQTTRHKGSQNICDFIVYKEPYEYYIECKSVHGNTLPFSNITETQWQGLLEKSKIPGVHAGIMCWWIDRDLTEFIPIAMLDTMKKNGAKSISYKCLMCEGYSPIQISGVKKRILFDYDMNSFFEEVR